MKIHNYKPNPSRKVPDARDIEWHSYHKDCQNVVLDKIKSDRFKAEAVIINGVFIGMLTISYEPNEAGELEPARWSMVFHELSRKELKIIGDKFKYCIPIKLKEYAVSTEIGIGDWPRVFNSKQLTCDLKAGEPNQEIVVIKKYNGKIDHERIFIC